MKDRNPVAPSHYMEPETRHDLHRPSGSPMPREIRSQKAQLESSHRHGTSKGVKWSISYKTGLREKE
ncbi:MAG: hypothetical protein ACOY81_09555 [Bacillota bacterium]|uniref:hypothetical protein n=1 Tax=Desulfurispora thermophila TaxID=265470 RepID=UPI000363CAD1|nr:hypothetical protein [Desulfurispora thermophila]